MIANLRAAVWAVCGGIVIAYLFFLAIGGVDPATATAVSLVVLALGLLWAWHARATLLHGGSSNRRDRERRGF